jgi:hypothetical protein
MKGQMRKPRGYKGNFDFDRILPGTKSCSSTGESLNPLNWCKRDTMAAASKGKTARLSAFRGTALISSRLRLKDFGGQAWFRRTKLE